jgi:hypothetical protein
MHSLSLFKIDEMVRNIIAIIIGAVVGGVLIAAGMFAISMAFPYAEIPTSPQEAKIYMETAPTINKVCITFNWALCGFIAASVTTIIQGRTDFRPMLATVGILQLLTYMNMLMLPGHPVWMWVCVTFMYASVGFISYGLLRKPRNGESI